jgi:hypothetical protein
MPAPWSDYLPIVEHTLSLVAEGARRSDFLDICWANDMGDDVIDGFDAIDERVLMKSADDVKQQLEALGQLTG